MFSITHRKLLFGCLFVFVLNSGQIWRDKTSRQNAEGNRLYRQKNYAEALQKYIEAQDGKKYRQELSYNIANTFYQQKKYPEAARELEKSISSDNPALNQKIYFNQGNSFYQMGQYERAVESYKKTLELDPKDRDTKHNLELALRKLQENPQQKQNSDNQNQKQHQNQRKDDSEGRNQEPNQQNQQKQPKQQNQPEQQKQNANQKRNQEQQNQPQKGERKPGMDPKEALRILDAINNQEKKEQRKQVLKIQREHLSGRDW